jgi:hypothetical protein
MITVDTVEDLQNAWRDPYRQWYAAGMPAYFTQNLEPWKQLSIKFKTMEDRNSFAEKLGYSLTEKTNVVVYPEKEREMNNTNRFVEDV